MSNSQQNSNERYLKDSRVTDNKNPSRPPIKKTDEQKPDPFDPFKTAYLADGGCVVQDPVESKFTTQIAETITPTSPSIPYENSTINGTGGDNSRVIHEAEERNRIDESHKRTPQKGLIKQVSTFLSTIAEEWEYHIQTDTDNTVFSHYGLQNNEISFSIQPTNNSFTLCQYDTDTAVIEQKREILFSGFAPAVATFIEGIDWGVIPKKTTEPLIWEYTGFDSRTETFEKYISGSNNIECGSHEFVNTAAEYKITIESYRDNRYENNGETLAILSIIRTRHDTKNGLLYRNRFAGQKQAFDFIFSALNEGLSREIALSDEKHGNTNAVPTVEFLTHSK